MKIQISSQRNSLSCNHMRPLTIKDLFYSKNVGYFAGTENLQEAHWTWTISVNSIVCYSKWVKALVNMRCLIWVWLCWGLSLSGPSEWQIISHSGWVSEGWQSPPLVCVWVDMTSMLTEWAENVHCNFLAPDVYGEDCTPFRVYAYSN